VDRSTFDRLARGLASRQNRRQSMATIAGAAAALAVTSRAEAGTNTCTLFCPEHQFLATNGTCDEVGEYPAPDSSFCGQSPTIVCDPPSGTTLPIGETTVTCTETVTNAECSFLVTVGDASQPTITCPADVFIETDVPIAVTLPDTVIGTICTNSTGQVPYCDFESGDVFPLGTTLVTCYFVPPGDKGPNPNCTYNVTLQPAPTATPTETPTDTPSTEVPATEVPTSVDPTSVPANPTATTAPVTELPNTGAGSDGSGAGKVLPIAVVGAGVALLARLGLRQRTSETDS